MDQNARGSMPQQQPGRSKQDVETPADFLAAIATRFGSIDVDLACTEENKKAPIGMTWPSIDSLAVDWIGQCGKDAIMFLNPRFADIARFAAKCAASVESMRGGKGRILLLTPAAIGTNWFASHVHGKAHVLALSPRLVFVGSKDPYPKDLMLSVYGWPAPFENTFGEEIFPTDPLFGFECWRWKSAARFKKERKARVKKLPAELRTVDMSFDVPDVPNCASYPEDFDPDPDPTNGADSEALYAMLP